MGLIPATPPPGKGVSRDLAATNIAEVSDWATQPHAGGLPGSGVVVGRTTDAASHLAGGDSYTRTLVQPCWEEI
jgi:hypothetical protein